MSNAEIVVVGAGVAGLSAALAVADAGQDVTLVTKADLVESNTYHAQGGIAAAVFADDDPKLHAADTMAAGHGLCEPRAVEILTREGADRVRQFAAAGVHFDRDAQGHMLRGLEAAHSRARVVHAGGDATGKVVELDGLDGWKNLGSVTVSLPLEHVGKGNADMAADMPHADFTESERFEGRVLTNFEKKGLAAGRVIHDFTYQAVTLN